jgi:hypothetical protein
MAGKPIQFRGSVHPGVEDRLQALHVAHITLQRPFDQKFKIVPERRIGPERVNQPVERRTAPWFTRKPELPCNA